MPINTYPRKPAQSGDADRLDWEPVSPLVRSGETSFDAVLAKLELHPQEAVCWSLHKSRGAAFQRIRMLKESSRFKTHPEIQFSTTTVVPGEPSHGAYIMIHL